MNHVPDEALESVDELGRGLLLGEPTSLQERLRSDLRFSVDCDRAALEAGTATGSFRLEHTSPAECLRGHGSYVRTIADNVDARLEAWGIDPPAAYTHRGTDDGWQVYEGTLELRPV